MRMRLAGLALFLGFLAAIPAAGTAGAVRGGPPIKVVSNLTLDLNDSVVFPYSATISDTVQLSGQLHIVSIVTLQGGSVTDAKLIANVSGLSGTGLEGKTYLSGGSYDISFVPSGPPIAPADLGGAMGAAQLDSFVFKLLPSGPPIDVLQPGSPPIIPGSPPIIPGGPPIRPLAVHMNLVFDAAGLVANSTNIALVEIQDPFGD